MTTLAASAAPFAGSGEFVMTRDDFRRIAGMLHADAGIALAESKSSLVYSRLVKRLRALGLASFRDYCRLVGSHEGLDERQRMLSALTPTLPRFFREPHHFEHLKREVLPPLLAEVRRGGRGRLWSAACSTGPEAYSAALSVLELMPDAADYDVRILATDIDPVMVEAAREGAFDEAQAAAIAPALRERWFEPVRDGGPIRWRVGDELRALVSVRELNLIADWPMGGKFDAVFCRNVAIYFDEPTQEALWPRLADRLQPMGALYIGHSERVTGPAADRLVPDGVTTYRPRLIG